MKRQNKLCFENFPFNLVINHEKYLLYFFNNQNKVNSLFCLKFDELVICQILGLIQFLKFY
jgi:hypothetical protein